MSPKKRLFPVLFAIFLLTFASLACELTDPSNEYANEKALEDQIPTLVIPPTPECGGNVSGTWNGTATGTRGTIQYSLTLIQNGCSVTGTQTSVSADGQTGSSPVSGTVDRGWFTFTETGSTEGTCYWTGTLQIGPAGDTLMGDVSNCSEPHISLFKE